MLSTQMLMGFRGLLENAIEQVFLVLAQVAVLKALELKGGVLHIVKQTVANKCLALDKKKETDYYQNNDKTYFLDRGSPEVLQAYIYEIECICLYLLDLSCY